MIEILTGGLPMSPTMPDWCICACYHPKCQSSWSYMEGYTDGISDTIYAD